MTRRPRTRRRRRAIITIVALALLTNIALAWIAARWAPLKHTAASNSATPLIFVRQYEGLGLNFATWIEDSSCFASDHAVHTPAWIIHQAKSGLGLKHFSHGEATRAGWPLRSMQCAVIRRAAFEDWPPEIWIESHGAALPRTDLSGNFLQRRPLPLIPVPLNFLLNTLFFAGIFTLAYLAYSVLRGGLYFRRGHCRRCGYNLAGLPESQNHCPECGEHSGGWPDSSPSRRFAPSDAGASS